VTDLVVNLLIFILFTEKRGTHTNELIMQVKMK